MNQELDKKIVGYLESRRDDLIREIRNLVGINSAKGEPAPHAPYGPGPRGALDYFLELGDLEGFQWEDVGGYCGVLTFPGTGQGDVAALCHLDIVPAGEGWTRDPFGSSPMEGSRLYGRGTGDNKGPAAATLFALKALMESGFQPGRNLKLIAGCDEESGMSDIPHYLAKHPAPEYAFSPDAGFPLVYGEKGHVNATETYRYAGPSAVKKLYAGEQVNVVPREAVAETTLTGLPESDNIRLEKAGGLTRIVATGRASHAAFPQGGVNAIGILTEYLTRILPENDPAYPAVSAISEKIGRDYDGKALGIACADDISGEMTLNMGILRGDEKGMELRIDIRYPVTLDPEEGKAALIDAFTGLGFSSSVRTTPPLHVPKDSPLVRILSKVYADCTGDDRPPVTMGGGTYARTLPRAVAFGPDAGGGAHEADEWVDIDRLLAAARIYAHAFAQLSEAE